LFEISNSLGGKKGRKYDLKKLVLTVNFLVELWMHLSMSQEEPSQKPVKFAE